MRHRLRTLICFFLVVMFLMSFNGCSSNYFIQKLWEIEVYESENEENIIPIKVIPDTINNLVYANYASKLLCIDISQGEKIWELSVEENKLIYDFIFDGSDFFISLVPKQYPKDELFLSNIAKIDTQTGQYLWNKEFSKSYNPVFLFFMTKNELIVAREGKCYILNRLNGEIMYEYAFPQVNYNEAANSSWTISDGIFYKYLPESKEIIRGKLPDFSNFEENLRFKNIVLPDDLRLSLVRDSKILLTSSDYLILGSEENREIIKNIKFEDISVDFFSRFVNLNNNYINPTIYKDYILGNYFSMEKKGVESGFLIVDFENGTYSKKKIEEIELGEIAIKAKFSPFIWKDTLFMIYEESDKDKSMLLAYSFPDLELLFTINENTKFLKKTTFNEIDFSNPPYPFANVETNNITGLIVAYSDRIILYTLNSK